MVLTQWQAEFREGFQKYRIEDVLRPFYNDVVP